MDYDLATITPYQTYVIEKGLCEYQYIMNHWQDNDPWFEKAYFDFYLKSRWSVLNEGNKQIYFRELQDITPHSDLLEILYYLNDCFDYGGLNQNANIYEFSISSKMLHTRNPNVPIYDSKIRTRMVEEDEINFWWQIPNHISGAPRGTSNIQKIEHDWNLLVEWYRRFLLSQTGMTWLEWFNLTFPRYEHISDVKKVDFIIFATTDYD